MEDTNMACNQENTVNTETRGRTLAVLLACLFAGSTSLALGSEVSLSASGAAGGSAQTSQSDDARSADSRVEGDMRTDAHADLRSDGIESDARAESGASASGSAESSADNEDDTATPPPRSRNRENDHGHSGIALGSTAAVADSLDVPVDAAALQSEGTATLANTTESGVELAGRVGNRAESQLGSAADRSQQVATRAQAFVDTSADAAIESGHSLGAATAQQADDTVGTIEVPETDGSVVTSATGNAETAADAEASDAVDGALESSLKGDIAGSINSTVQDDIRDSIQADLVTDITRSLPLPGRN
jgi:hypothetical protein